MERSNTFAPPSTKAPGEHQAAFGILLSMALVVPGLVAMAAWCLQWVVEFPPHTTGASLTTIAIVGGTLGALAAVPLAITKLIHKPSLGTNRNVLLMAFGAGMLPPDMCFVAILNAGW